MKKILFCCMVICLIFAAKASAQNLLVESNHNPGTTLLKCEIAEAGFRLNDDHPAIMWVLYRRATRGLSEEQLANLSQNELNLSMAHLALRYCNALREHPRPPRSNRRAWAIRGMSTNWIRRHVGDELIRLVDDWMIGVRAPDTCAVPALHWGSRRDIIRHGFRIRDAINCGHTQNYFMPMENGPRRNQVRRRHHQ